MQSTPRARVSKSVQSGWLACVLVGLRMLALLMAAELSGAAHLAIDAYEMASVGEHHLEEHHDCEDEESGHECPPGCLNCHCTHSAVLAFSARYEPRYRAVLFEPDVPRAAPRLDARPKQRSGESIYRPPRTHA